MLRPNQVSAFSFFYALGNTPAVNLTQDLPRENKSAKVLQVGCGDARSVLFTIHNETGNRASDFTCCDIEPPIIARNILLFSLILDDKVSDSLWDIYLHVAIKDSSHALLNQQADQLVKCDIDAIMASVPVRRCSQVLQHTNP